MQLSQIHKLMLSLHQSVVESSQRALPHWPNVHLCTNHTNKWSKRLNRLGSSLRESSKNETFKVWLFHSILFC